MSNSVVTEGYSCGGVCRGGGNITLFEKTSNSVVTEGYSCGGVHREGGNITLFEKMSDAVVTEGYSCGGDRREGGDINLVVQTNNDVAAQGYISGGINSDSGTTAKGCPSYPSIAANASLVCSMRLSYQFSPRFTLELAKIVGVCYEPHLLWELPSKPTTRINSIGAGEEQIYRDLSEAYLAFASTHVETVFWPAEAFGSASQVGASHVQSMSTDMPTVHAEDYKVVPKVPAEDCKLVPIHVKAVLWPAGALGSASQVGTSPVQRTVSTHMSVPAEDCKLVPIHVKTVFQPAGALGSASQVGPSPVQTMSTHMNVPAEDYKLVPTVHAEDYNIVPTVHAEDYNIVLPQEAPLSLPIDDLDLSEVASLAPHARGGPSNILIAMIVSLMCPMASNAGVRWSNEGSHIYIAATVSQMCLMKLLCLFSPRFFEHVKIVGVCKESLARPTHVSIAVTASSMCPVRLSYQFPSRFLELVKIVGVCREHLCQCQLSSLPRDRVEDVSFFQIISTSSVHCDCDRTRAVLQSVLHQLNFRHHRQSPTFHGLSVVNFLPSGSASPVVYYLPNGSTSSHPPLVPVFESSWPCGRCLLLLIYPPQFFISSMKMGQASVGSACLKRHRQSVIHRLVRDTSIRINCSSSDSTSSRTSIRIYCSSCDSAPSRFPRVCPFLTSQETPSLVLSHTRSNPLLSPSSFSLRLHDLAEELSPQPKSMTTCGSLAVHAILLCLHISIAMIVSLMWMVRLLCQFPFRFCELLKIVGVCWKTLFSGLSGFRRNAWFLRFIETRVLLGVSPVWNSDLL